MIDSIKDVQNNQNLRLTNIGAVLVSLIKHGALPFKAEGNLELAFLFDTYNSDKDSICRIVHTYADTYHSLFSPIRNEIKAVFECGVFKGGSLRAWRDYFQNAVIIAGDIDKSTLFEEDRIHTALLDQMNNDSIAEFFTSLAPKYPDMFDIMIDDGCHIYEATTCLFEQALKYLKPNGIYIIEDMLEKYFPAYKDFFKSYIDKGEIEVEYKNLVSRTNDPHNNLIIIRKTVDTPRA
jgi:SAM-dependent methyltransferase